MIPRYQSPLSVRNLLEAALGTNRIEGGSWTEYRNGYLTWMFSASDALHRWLLTRPIKGLAILPAYTCIRVVQSVRMAGWSVAFTDIDRHTLAMDVARVTELVRISSKPVVIVATHLHGLPAPLSELRRVANESCSLMVEDCAMAQGAIGPDGPVGTTGDAAILSFGLGKVISLGWGGCLLTRAPLTLPRTNATLPYWLGLVRLLGRAGWVGSSRLRLQDTISRLLGRTRGASEQGFSPTEVSQAASRFLASLVSQSSCGLSAERRQARSSAWIAWIQSLNASRLGTFKVVAGSTPSYPSLPMLAEDRQILAEKLLAAGVDTSANFSYCAARLAGDLGRFPNARWIAQRILLLPLDDALDKAEHRIKQILSDHARLKPKPEPGHKPPLRSL